VAVVIASHHLKDTWRPRLDWPDGTHVQWGRGGLVLRGSGNYLTAFFEAFPRDGSAGFLRGEGADIALAESDAFRQWSSANSCLRGSGHRWSRQIRKNGRATGQIYQNGGCICASCGSFSISMKPIVQLADWSRAPTRSELASILLGGCKPPPHSDMEMLKHSRRLELRARAAKIRLPDIPPGPAPGLFCEDPYRLACRQAVLDYTASRGEQAVSAIEIFS
jgi:hypothetical protein